MWVSALKQTLKRCNGNDAGTRGSDELTSAFTHRVSGIKKGKRFVTNAEIAKNYGKQPIL